MREAVLQRGVRADEAAPGSGLGLAIVRELAELYGGSIALGGSPAGGLRATPPPAAAPPKPPLTPERPDTLQRRVACPSQPSAACPRPTSSIVRCASI